LAALGRREADGGSEVVDDPGLAARLRRQARDIHLQSVLCGVAVTALVLLIPG